MIQYKFAYIDFTSDYPTLIKNVNYLKSGTLKNASFLENNSIILQVHPTISINELKRRAKILRSVLIRAQK